MHRAPGVAMVAVAIVAGVLTGTASAQQSQIAPDAGGKPICYEIQSTVPFTILTHIMLPSRVTSVARIDPNTMQRHCMQGAPFPDGRVNFRIVSGLGPPLFSCQTRVDKPIFVSANKEADGSYKYEVTCY